MLERVLAFCDVNLSDPSLSASSIARTHRVSVRYLHKLFATVDETPAGYIRRRRLELVRRDLASPELAGVPVARLATRHGLSDAPHFSRLFRATYGCTPGDYRATALSAGSLLPRTGTPS
jgi:AraC-like DNA-binding protein